MGDLSDILGKQLSLKNNGGSASGYKSGSGSSGKLITKNVMQPLRKNETEDDIAILSLIMPGEKFRCHMGSDCLFGDPGHSSLGTKKMEYRTRHWHEKCFACCVCKNAIGTKSFIPRDSDIYDPECYEEKFGTKCVKCKKIISSGGVTYKDEPYHKECFTCSNSNCNKNLAGHKFTSKDNLKYCAECYGELFANKCYACTKPITGFGGTRFISFEDRHWHNDCFNCASCKGSLVGKGFITDADDMLCPDCAKAKLI